MIEFPCNLHNLHHFKRDGERFVADLDAGVVIPVNEVVCDILNACSVSETDVIVDTLADKHGSRSEVLEALVFLSELSEMGILFSSDPLTFDPPAPKDRLKIYVSPGVFESRETTPFLSSAANHHLVARLAAHADVYLPLSESDNNRQEIEEDVRAEGVQPIFFRNDRSFSPAKFMPKGCDGILALSPLTEGEEVFLKFNTIPVVLRLSNAALVSHAARNAVLERAVALRNFDAFAADASWTQNFFSDVVSDQSVFHQIPYGVDTSIFKPMDKTKCKHQLAQALGNEAILQKPLVGVVQGLHPHEMLRFMRKLRVANPNVNYLVIHSSLMDDFKSDGCVNFFNIASLQDKEASPFLFNALDVLVFPAILGASPLLLLEIVACGIPTIVCGYAVPEEISGACRFVETSSTLFDPIQLPVESVSQELKLLLENPEEQRCFGQAGLAAVSTYTWEAAIQRILNLFRYLRRCPTLPPKSTKHRLLFKKHYNLVSGEIESEALVISRVPTPIDVEQGIAMTLLDEQTPMEIKILLESICREPEHAKKILENLI